MIAVTDTAFHILAGYSVLSPVAHKGPLPLSTGKSLHRLRSLLAAGWGTAVMKTIEEIVANSKNCSVLREFHQFHRSHPEVLDFLVEAIEARIARGFTAYSCGSLWEYARWKLDIEKGPSDTYKLNDKLEPYYARAIVILHTEYNGMQEFRKAKADDVFGTRIEPAPKKRPKHYALKLQWADGTPLQSQPPKKPSSGVAVGDEKKDVV